MSWRIFQRVFNAPPRRNARYITDKSGKKFWILWDAERFERLAELHVLHRGRWVGILSSMREEDGSITLTDMLLHQKDHVRERGLGKGMIRELIRWGKDNHFKRIAGVIQPHDGSTLKYLSEWYRRQGFRVQDRNIFFEL